MKQQFLMLTARDGIDEKIKGLDLGADDYWLNLLILEN